MEHDDAQVGGAHLRRPTLAGREVHRSDTQDGYVHLGAVAVQPVDGDERLERGVLAEPLKVFGTTVGYFVSSGYQTRNNLDSPRI